jgi:hypothetical protein
MGDYPYYESWSSIRVSPKQSYVNDFNAINDFAFSNAPNVFTDITQETTLGGGIYSSITARVDAVIEPKTGRDLGDDWKVFEFLSSGIKRSMGTRFYWQSNYWVTVNTDNYQSLSNSCIVHRCNNALEKRKADGSLIKEPCIIFDGYTSDSFDISKETVLADGEILVCAQNNINTRLFDINDEVAFGGQAFKIESKKNFLNNTTYGNDPPLITWKMKKVDASGGEVAPDSEFVIFTGGEKLDIHNVFVLQGDTTVFTVYKFESGIQQADTMTFSIDSSSQVASSKYIFTQTGDNTFSVKNNAQDITYTLVILCTDNADASTETIDISLRGAW